MNFFVHFSNNSDSTTQSSCDSGVGYPPLGTVYPVYSSPGRGSPKIAQGPHGIEVAEYRLMQRVVPGEYRDYYEPSSVGYVHLAHAAEYPGDGMAHEPTDDTGLYETHNDHNNIHHHHHNNNGTPNIGMTDQTQHNDGQHGDFHQTNNVDFPSQHH